MDTDRRFIWRVEPGTPGTEATRTSHTTKRSARHACRVLVVDDDVLIRAQLCALLHGSDYEVETAASGEDALRLLRSYPCDIVITDWEMPIMDGVTLCRRVRSMERQDHVYMLMLTVKSAPQELLLGFAAGADDYVIKGTSSEELLARMEKGRSLAHFRATHGSEAAHAGDRSLTDAMTGAYTVAYLLQHLPREIARTERYGRSLSVLKCEIGARVQEPLAGPVGDEQVHRFVSCSMTCIRKSDWLVRSGDSEFMIVLPETDTKGARCVARKLSEAFVRPASPAAKQAVDGAIKFKLTAMEPASDGGSAASMRALILKAEGLQYKNRHDEKRAADTGKVHYLSDLKSASEPTTGRNWPAT